MSESAPLVLGMRLSRALNGLAASFAFGAAAALAFVGKAHLAGEAAPAAANLLLVFSLPAVMWVALSALMATLSVRLSDAGIEQLFLGRWVVAAQPLEALTSVAAGDYSALVFRFRNRDRMRLPGLNRADRALLLAWLKVRRPDIREF